VKKKASIVFSQEIRNHFLCLASAAHNVHGLQDSNDVLEKKLSIVGPSLMHVVS
jgi:hypothetical protein